MGEKTEMILKKEDKKSGVILEDVNSKQARDLIFNNGDVCIIYM